MAVFAVWYGAVRFWLDFYRITDATYLGLTPAQYVSAAMAVGGAYLACRIYQRKHHKRPLPRLGRKRTEPWYG